jgi:hypothetical protein
MGRISCLSSSSIPFHRVGLLPRADGSTPRRARFLFSPVEAHLPSPLIDAIVGIAALRRQEHVGNSTWHARIFWSARISCVARARWAAGGRVSAAHKQLHPVSAADRLTKPINFTKAHYRAVPYEE